MTLANGNGPNVEIPTIEPTLEATSVTEIVPTVTPSPDPSGLAWNYYVAIIAFLILVSIGVKAYFNKNKVIKK